MKEVDIISKVVGRDTSGKAAMYIPGAGAPSVDLDDYLLKKIWDSVFEIRTDSEGTPYLFEKLPFVTQYGITMYADGGNLNLPSIYAGLPIDNQTLFWENGVLKARGGTEGAITSITSTMVVDALGYIPANGSDVTALQNKVNDFLSGSDTDTIINKWKELEAFLSGLSESDNLATILGNKADKATTLAGYGITDAYTKTKVDELLSLYVTLAGTQTITGEKNFTGGLKVNGSPIVYDATNKYWKLEGDLLVTGGVTMYGSDSEFSPSTIMDGVNVDGVTIGKNANGALTFIGSVDGGIASSVLWDNIEGTPSWIGDTKPSYTYSEISGTPTLLSSFTDDVVDGHYLPITGGILTGPLQTNISSSEWSLVSLTNNSSFYASNGGGYGIFSSVNHSDSSKYLLRLHYNDSSLGGSGNVAMLVRCDGRVGVMTDYPSYEFEVSGDAYVSNWIRTGTGGWYSELYGGGMYMEDSTYIRTYGGKIVYIQETGFAGSNAYGIGGHTLQLLIGGGSAPHASILLRSNTVGWGIASNTNGNMYIGQRPTPSPSGYGSDIYVLELSTSGLLCYGGMTMYSDIRKKTKLQDVELTLKQIADAPLIEHYYNSDSNKTTHVGSIAQYWAGLNDWFCKKDSEGFYTMEIQNAALASAISIAKELSRYESKTDKEIRLLKDEVKRLKKEIKILKSA